MTKPDLDALLPHMIPIPAGSFLMGTPDADRSRLAKRYGGTRESYAEESPQHAVALPAFAIAQTPVTNALYAAFCADTGATMPITWGGALPDQLRDHPVVDVSWDDAQRLCAWLRDRTDRVFRLPTEAEWEKAARGDDGRAWAWGDEFDPQRCNVKETGIGSTTPVDRFRAGASPYGVWDMCGNVWEWTQSLQAPYPYADDGRNGAEPRIERRAPRFLQRLLRTAPEHAPPPVETRRILRGGCYANPEGFARCACRLRLPPDRKTPFVGVRLACDV
jgi:toxoflavin biosynthesis protein ToxD